MVLLLIFLMISAGGAIGYQIIEVKNGATVNGTVDFEGSAPADESFEITSDADYCGEKQQVGKYILAGSKVKNVVVWIEGVDRGKTIPEKTVEVVIKKCRATPHVNFGFVGGEYLFRNDDPILHTVQTKLGLAYQKTASSRPLADGTSIYNLALPQRGLEIKKPIKKWHHYSSKTGYIQVRSNTHTWIRGYIFIFNHPYAALTDKNGTFSIGDLPSGTYTLKAWHEGFGIKEQKIEVEAGRTLEVGIVFEK
jgi:hypothetical protein